VVVAVVGRRGRSGRWARESNREAKSLMMKDVSGDAR
jgi:hypothetical protein